MKFKLKYICLVLLLLFSIISYGQTVTIKKNLTIIKRGFCDDETKSCPQQQINFLKACNDLGDLYFNRHNFQTALKYYLKAIKINDHIYMATHYAQKLQKTISAKASYILWNHKHSHEDSVSAFFIDFRYLSECYEKKLISLSEHYFHFSKDTFYGGYLYNQAHKRQFLFAINPLFIINKRTRSKIVSTLNDSLINAKTVTLTLACMDFPNSEQNQAYFYSTLFNIRDRLQKRFPGINFMADVDCNSGIEFPDIRSFISFPLIKVTIDQ